MPQMSRQLELPFEEWGEAPARGGSVEATTAKKGSEHLGSADLMEKVVSRPNLLSALKRVRKNKGSPGIDGMTVGVLPAFLIAHWARIREELLAGTYQPAAIRRVEIPKSGGGMRELGIPTVLDRFSIMLFVLGFLGLVPDDHRREASIATGSVMLGWALTYQLTVGTVCYSLVSEISTRKLQIKTVVLGRVL